MDELLSLLGYLDVPRQQMFKALGSESGSGADLLGSLFGADPSSAMTQVLGTGAEMLGDPLNLAFGAGGLLGGAHAYRVGRGANALRLAREAEVSGLGAQAASKADELARLQGLRGEFRTAADAAREGALDIIGQEGRALGSRPFAPEDQPMLDWMRQYMEPRPSASIANIPTTEESRQLAKLTATPAAMARSGVTPEGVRQVANMDPEAAFVLEQLGYGKPTFPGGSKVGFDVTNPEIRAYGHTDPRGAGYRALPPFTEASGGRFSLTEDAPWVRPFGTPMNQLQMLPPGEIAPTMREWVLRKASEEAGAQVPLVTQDIRDLLSQIMAAGNELASPGLAESFYTGGLHSPLGRAAALGGLGGASFSLGNRMFGE